MGFLLADISSSLLTEEEDRILVEVQENFVARMARPPVPDVSSPEYHLRWKEAQQYSDDLLRLRLGADGFNRMNFLAAQEAERSKQRP